MKIVKVCLAIGGGVIFTACENKEQEMRIMELEKQLAISKKLLEDSNSKLDAVLKDRAEDAEKSKRAFFQTLAKAKELGGFSDEQMRVLIQHVVTSTMEEVEPDSVLGLPVDVSNE